MPYTICETCDKPVELTGGGESGKTRVMNVHRRWYCKGKPKEAECPTSPSYERTLAEVSRTSLPVKPVTPQASKGNMDLVDLVERIDAATVKAEIAKLDKRRRALAALLTVCEARDFDPKASEPEDEVEVEVGPGGNVLVGNHDPAGFNLKAQ